MFELIIFSSKSYFEEDTEAKKNSAKECEYQPASDSSSSSEEEDPLDSFMANIEVWIFNCIIIYILLDFN